MWPFSRRRRKAIVVFHIDREGLAQGAFFRGDADVLIIDERDPRNRVYRMSQETPRDELARRIGRHPLGRLLTARDAARDSDPRAAVPVLNLHWRNDAQPVQGHIA
jgi:hypothetical protein